MGGREPARRFSRQPSALTAEDQGPGTELPHEQPSSALGVSDPAMLREEPQVSDHLLAVHRGPFAPCRRSADVEERRAWEELDAPATLPHAVAEVDLFAVHEEVRVEVAN